MAGNVQRVTGWANYPLITLIAREKPYFTRNPNSKGRGSPCSFR
nr:MAG TPA: hypothetical protein [Bacteriophage sp.]